MQQDQIIDQVQNPLCMDEEQKEHEEVADSPRVDVVKDRVYKHPLKNLKLKVLYQNWHVGTITWYNKVWTSIYRIEYEDGTDDYINLDYVDGIEIILLG